MADSWFALSREDQAEALEVAAAQTGRPPHLLEKDIWVVWTLSAIYESSLADKPCRSLFKPQQNSPAQTTHHRILAEVLV